MSSTSLPHASHAESTLAGQVLERQQTGVAVLDAGQRIIHWNPWIAEWTGVTATQALQRRLDDLFPGLAGGELVRALGQVIRTGTPICWSQQLDPERLDRVEAEMTPGDRPLPLLRLALSRIASGSAGSCLLEVVEAPFPALWNGRATAVTGDSDPQVRVDSDGAGILSLDRLGRIAQVNEQFCTWTGFSIDQLRGGPARLVFPDLERQGASPVAQLRAHARAGTPLAAATAEGEPRWLDVIPCTPPQAPDGLVLVCRDAGTRLADRGQAQQELERLAAVLADTGDAVIVVDEFGFIERINPVALELLGAIEAEVAGCALDELLTLFPAKQGADPAPHSVHRALAAGTRLVLPPGTTLRCGAGATLFTAGALTPLRNRDNRVSGGVLTLRVGTEARPESRRLAWQAEHDNLTGLPNRAALARAIAGELKPWSGRGGALLYIDLLNFSQVNDTCGHAAGDALLCQAAHILAGHLEPGSLLARVGNDEFALLLHDADADTATATATAVLDAFRDFTFPWGERRIKVGISLGCEVFDSSAESDIGVLVAAAAHCNKAREFGRNRMYCPVGKAGDTRKDGFSTWIPRISEALEEGRFRLYLQPIVALDEQAARAEQHCEALVRMIDRDAQLVSPLGFIPAAERYGLIDDIDRWVVAEALRILQRCPASQPLKLSVNLSGATISDDSSGDFIVGLIDRSGVDPRRLQFEITETAAIRQFDRALALIHRLRGHGCYLALDDFGSGLSSLRYLQEIPVDFLKIDGVFIRRVERSEVDLAMVSTINDLAHIMGIRTIAESVENATQLSIVRQLGVDYAQGFHLALPQPPESILAGGEHSPTDLHRRHPTASPG